MKLSFLFLILLFLFLFAIFNKSETHNFTIKKIVWHYKQETYNCNKDFRYNFSIAIVCLLNESNLKLLYNFSREFKGENELETAWNILDWVEKNIEYNYSKIDDWYIQTPIETLNKGTGICVDYTLLISTLLINNNITPYILEIKFYNTSTGHVSAGIFVNNTLFVIDQNLPPLYLGAYYAYWNKLGNKIKEIKFYFLENKNSTYFLRPVNISFQNYTFNSFYLDELREEIKKEFKKIFNWYKYDKNLEKKAREFYFCNIENKSCDINLPFGYWKGKFIFLTSYPYWEYHPLLSNLFAKDIVKRLYDKNITEYNKFAVYVNVSSYYITINNKTVKEKIILTSFTLAN